MRMKRVVYGLTALLALVPIGAFANVGTFVYSYAYPVPWSPSAGSLTLHYESGNVNAPTFIIVDALGEEVARLTGVRIAHGRAENIDGYEFEVVEFEAVWDGCNRNGRPVKAGTYLCYVGGRVFRFIVVR
ncbi:hypothetical protein KAU45_06700 [bacterium]|nr:hypothetical protein [bacterium]